MHLREVNMHNRNGRIKRIHWFRSVLKDVVENDLHSIFNLSVATKPEIALMEPIQITIGDPDEQPIHFGIAEVIGIKHCCIGDLESTDLARQKPGFRTKKDTIDSLRKMHPEYRSDIHMGTEITVVTLRRCDYDLKKLSSMMKRKGNKDRGKVT